MEERAQTRSNASPERPARLVGIIVILFGAVLIAIGTFWDFRPLADLSLHFGTAIFVAGAVGLAALTHEFRSLFIRLLEEVLVDQSFFRSLDAQKLEDIGEKAFRASYSRHVQNDEHQWAKMYEAIKKEVLPLVRNPHREDYDESVSLEFLTVRDLANELGFQAPVGRPDDEVCRMKGITTFKLVGPVREETTYPYKWELETDEVPGLDAVRHAEVWVQKDEGTPEQIALTAKATAGTVHMVGEVPVKYRGSCSLRITETKLESNPTFSITIMPALTLNFALHVATNTDLTFNHFVFGMGGKGQVAVEPRLISVKHSGWLLPNQGAIVYWRRVPN